MMPHVRRLPTADLGSSDPMLSVAQAYESAYRFVAQYYERERIGCGGKKTPEGIMRAR
jgi:hypothetical protein